jgi:phosphatidylglycerophosphatase A
MPRHPGPAFALAHPAHFIALGFGVGALPVAPGTFGTLVALPLWWLLGAVTEPLALVAVLVALFALGVWACAVTGRHLGAADHGAMVWDEVRVRAVPRFRHRQAGADPCRRAALQGRLRRDVR